MGMKCGGEIMLINQTYLITTLDLEMTLTKAESDGSLPCSEDFIGNKKPVHKLYEDKNILLYIVQKK